MEDVMTTCRGVCWDAVLVLENENCEHFFFPILIQIAIPWSSLVAPKPNRDKELRQVAGPRRMPKDLIEDYLKVLWTAGLGASHAFEIAGWSAVVALSRSTDERAS